MSETTELYVPETTLIQTGPEPSADHVEQEAPRSAREEAMARIAARHEETRARELALGETYADDARERAGFDAHETEREPSPEPAPVRAADPKPEPVPQRRRVELPTGQVFEVNDDEYAYLARMGAIAAAQQRAPEPQYQPPVSQPAVIRSPISTEEARELARRISYGSDDDGAQAVIQLAENLARQMPQVDPAQIAEQATQSVLQRVALQNNLSTIATEYPDIFNDASLSQLAALKLHEVRSRDQMLGVVRQDLDLYREACGMVHRALGRTAPQLQSKGPQPTTPPVQAAPDQSRLERKRAAPRQPVAASRVAGMGPEAPRQMTGSEIVDRMRQSRHQPSMMR